MRISTWIQIALAASLTLAWACGSDDSDDPGPGVDAGGQAGGSGGAPVGGEAPDPDDMACGESPDAHTAFLQAPTEATVVRKTPTHPPVGPEGLP
jgi:hypothetical protein